MWDELLANAFPFLYALVVSKEAWVVDVWDDMGEGGILGARHINDRWQIYLFFNYIKLKTNME